MSGFLGSGKFSESRGSQYPNGTSSPPLSELDHLSMDEESGLRDPGLAKKDLTSPLQNGASHDYGAENIYGDEKQYNGDSSSNRGAQEFGRQTKTNQEVRDHVQAVIDDTEGLQKPTIVRNLAIAYVISVLIVILLSVAGQVAVHIYITNSYSDALVVNISGRQRMLSQLITKDALAITLGIANGEDVTYYVNELKARLATWRDAHYGLWYGSDALGLPGTNSMAILRNFELLSSEFEAMYAAGQSTLALDPLTIKQGTEEFAALQSQLAVIRANERVFLPVMDTITQQFEDSSRRHLDFVLVLSWVLHSLVIVTLLMEGVFLFRPVLRKMQQLINERFDLMRRTLAAEAESSGVSLLMMAYVSNELQTPLRALEEHLEGAAEAVITHAERELKHDFLLDGIRADCQLAIENLQQGHMCVGLMDTVVADVASMRNLEVGRMAVAVDLVDVAGVVRQVMRLVGKKVRPSVALEADIEAALQQDPRRQVDKHRLQQVLLNLVNNALRTTTAGAIGVRVRTVLGMERLRFEVQDSGPELDPEEQASAFLPVMTSPGASMHEAPAQQGPGLSLYIVRMLVELQGGTVGTENAPSGGNVFWFELPAPREGAMEAMQTAAYETSNSKEPLNAGALPAAAALLVREGSGSLGGSSRKIGLGRNAWP